MVSVEFVLYRFTVVDLRGEKKEVKVSRKLTVKTLFSSLPQKTGCYYRQWKSVGESDF